MRKQTLVALFGIALLVGVTAAWAHFPSLDLSPNPGPYDGRTIEVPPGDIETIYFHITEPGLWHVGGTSFEWWIVNLDGVGMVTLLDEMVAPTTEYQGSVWYPFGVIRVDGKPSTTFGITINLDLGSHGVVVSNPIWKHITPEPSSILALGMGTLGMGGLLLRRRRS